MDPTAVSIERHPRPSRSRWALLGATAVLAPIGIGLAAAPAAHAYDLAPGSFKAGTLTSDQDGADADSRNFFTAAGGRPTFGITDFAFATDSRGEPVGQTRNLRVSIPAGLTPNPRAVPTCTDAQLKARACPVESQIGVQHLTIRGTVTLLGRNTINVRVPLYNMTRTRDQVARFAFNPEQAPLSGSLQGDKSPIEIIGGVRSSDYGLFFTIPKVPKDPGLVRSKLVFWGVPGDESHDPERGTAQTKLGAITAPGGTSRSVTDKTTAFLSMPTSCAGQQTSFVTATSHDGEQRSATYTTPVGVNGCDKVPFAPGIEMGPEQITRDSPSGLDVGLRVPQSQNSRVPATSHVKDVAFTLPPGATISPSVANGLQTCTAEQFAKGTNTGITCPASSRVGTATIKTPLLDDALTGNVYLGDPLPGDRYRLLISADGPGFSVRLTGSVRPDPQTGQLTTVVNDAPQLPFTAFDLHFDDGPRSVIATPQTCDTATSSATFTPWSGRAAVNASASQQVTGCNGFPFEPAFGAEASPQAGAFAPLTVAFGRNDGDQFLSRVSAELPPGLLAKIKGVPRCTEAQIAAQACPESSRVGTASVQAGPGSAPYPLSGPVYLTNAYGGGSFGFATIIHAVAGPYDLGKVVVRQAVKIDPEDAHVTVASDPLPQIQEGVVLRLRSLRLAVDRPGFVRNPTSCGPKRLTATLGSANGAEVQRAAEVSFGDCAKQAFRPKMKLEFTNKKQMGKGRNPGVRATVTQADGESGIKFTTVALPKSVALASQNAKALCEAAAALKDACPAASIVGNATATTSILEKPLKGPVYFVKGQRVTASGKVVPALPTLFVKLQGETTIHLRAITAVSHGRLVTTFPSIPDAPLSSFSLNIGSGKNGIIATTTDLCRGTQKGSARFSAHSGKKAPTVRPRIATACGKRPGLKVRSAKRSGSTLKIAGTVAKSATGRVSAKLTCGSTAVRATATPKKGRWTATVRLSKRCATAAKGTLTASVASKGKYGGQTLKARTVKLRS